MRWRPPPHFELETLRPIVAAVTAALASGFVHCIRYGRRNGREPGLAHTGGLGAAVDDHNLNLGRLIHAQHGVIVEIALLDRTAFEIEPTIECGRESIDHAAFDL